MRNLIVGALLAVFLFACGGAAAVAWDEERIQHLEAETAALRHTANTDAFLLYELNYRLTLTEWQVFGAPDPLPEFPPVALPFPEVPR